MTMSKLKVSKIMLETKDGQALHLTLDEARDLHAQLAELFAPRFHDRTPPIVIERDRWPLPWSPYQPIWVSAPKSGDPAPVMPYVTCSAQSGLKTHFAGPECE